jgi:hypothetical protein
LVGEGDGCNGFSTKSTLLSDDTLFPATERVQGQAQSRKAYHEIADRFKQYEWWADYLALRERGWDWRKAVYIAWSASPKKTRLPETQAELAQNVLGLSSAQVISRWRNADQTIDDTIAELQAAPLMRHRRDIFDALIASASDPDPKSHADRKLALEMMGDYKPKQQTELVGKDGTDLIPIAVVQPGLLEKLR